MNNLLSNKENQTLSIRIVLDRSGSMQGSEKITIKALNTYLKNLKKENSINAFEDVKDILDIFNYSIQQIIVKDIDLTDEKYQYLFTVDSINNLVVDGMSFREAYQQIGSQVQDGTYKPDMSKQHSHIGSIGNLCLDKIKSKYPK